jgi:hypothetical protein
MISVILYGRNDSHGYNLHKRAAISLNCIAEVLSDPDDEILFVDYNTPNDLPTFIEAIYDTLTERVKSRLRVFRVRPELHARLAGETHLFALEPHSRNIAIRRSNPRNRWLLLTNTDMILVPRSGFSDLPDAVRDLADGLYIAPRFELPEPFWESFPRSDPQAVMRACDELGPKLHLHEVALRVPFMRFDSPGDFQLVPRRAMFDIQGFDERMIHGWHADSNICKRLYLYYGERTESLAHRMKGYHCDHTRVATLAHRFDLKLENSLQEFVWGLTDPVAHHQAKTWGAPEEQVEELDFVNDPAAKYVRALCQTLESPQESDYESDANDARNFVYYPPERALPYLAGNLTVYPRNARFVYAGNNPRMLELASGVVASMGFEHPLHYIADLLTSGEAPSGAVPIRLADAAGNGSRIDDLLANYSPLIFDFGLDPTGLDLGTVARVTDWPRELRYSLGAVARLMEACAEQSDSFRGQCGHVPDFLVLNANHYIFQRFAQQFLLSTETPYPLHVRKGRPRVGEERLYRGSAWKYDEDLLRSFFAYDELDHSLASVTPDHSVDFTSQGNSARYKDGHWGAMDFTGTWTDGSPAAIVFAPSPSFAGDLVAYVRINEAFLGVEEQQMRLRVYFEGEFLTHWTVYTRLQITVCKAVLPSRLIAAKKACRLELHVENPQSVDRAAKARGETIVNADPRELGVKVQSITLAGSDRLRYALLDTLDFAEDGTGIDHTNECWTQPDDFGTWTLGPDANLVLLLNEPVQVPLIATFTVTDAVVSDQEPQLDVDVAINGRIVAAWTLVTRFTHERKILLREGYPTSDPLLISFHVRSPRTPMQMGWSTWDKRPLGFRLTKFSMAPAGSLKYKLGDIIDLTDAGNAAVFVGDFLGTQWALADRYGSWTMAEECTLKLPLETPLTTSVPASFVITDSMVSKTSPPLIVRVRANGHLAGEWSFGPSREPHRRSVMLPAEALAGSLELILTFEIPSPRSPASLGWNTDSRSLGFRLARAVVGRSDIEIPRFGGFGAVPRSMFKRILGLPGFSLHVARILLKKWDER